MSDPTTEAGRDLLEVVNPARPRMPETRSRLVLREAIERVEAEAAAAALSAARERVEVLLMQIVNRTKPMDETEGLAILAALAVPA